VLYFIEMYDLEEDNAAVRSVLSGDTGAFRLLVDRYNDRLYQFCRARLGSDADAEDAVQDVFVRAYRSLRSYDTSRSWASWLFAIAANRVRTRHAARAASTRLVERVGREGAVGLEERQNGSDVEILTLEAIAAEELREAVATLPVSYRATVELYYFAGLSVSDVAGVLQLGTEAVKTRLFRARKALFSRLSARGEQPEGRKMGSN
jgi:RNA polymerase sigma-70 factor (ECF subfamily)